MGIAEYISLGLVLIILVLMYGKPAWKYVKSKRAVSSIDFSEVKYYIPLILSIVLEVVVLRIAVAAVLNHPEDNLLEIAFVLIVVLSFLILFLGWLIWMTCGSNLFVCILFLVPLFVALVLSFAINWWMPVLIIATGISLVLSFNYFKNR